VSRTDVTTTTTPLRPDGRTLGVAAAGGVVAYLVGYALTYAAVGREVSNSLAARVLEIATGDPGTWQLVGWVFYNAHYVPVEVPGVFGSTAVNLVGDPFTSALLVVPPVALLAGGAAVAVVGGADEPVAGAVAGLAVTVGYLPLSALGAVAVGIDIGDATAGPTVAAAVLLAGLVYPLVFGAVGGAAGSGVADRR
jgi:hypothetical protein